MDQLLFHPKVVHLPIALAVLMPLVSLPVLIAWWRGRLPRAAWLIVIGLQALLLGSGAVAMQSGEREEDRVEAFVPESRLEAHEEAAEAFVWASGAVLAVMLIAGVLPSKRARHATAALATLSTLVVLTMGYQVGEAGGALVYEDGAASAYTGSITTAQRSGPPDGRWTRTGHDRDHDEDD